jgi:hypothetical protein
LDYYIVLGPERMKNRVVQMASLMKYLSILSDATIKTLAKLFNLILKAGQYPEQWNKSYLILLKAISVLESIFLTVL